MTLLECFDRHRCDKGSLRHRYDRLYEMRFAPLRNVPIRLLEIGVLGGASLAAWLDYFPNATVIGVDTFERVPAEQVAILDHPRVQWFSLDSTRAAPDIEPVDIVIDDGFHEPEQQVMTFGHFFPLTRRAYFIEDCDPNNRAHVIRAAIPNAVWHAMKRATVLEIVK